MRLAGELNEELAHKKAPDGNRHWNNNHDEVWRRDGHGDQGDENIVEADEHVEKPAWDVLVYFLDVLHPKLDKEKRFSLHC